MPKQNPIVALTKSKPEVIYDEWYHKAHVVTLPGLGAIGLNIDERCSVRR